MDHSFTKPAFTKAQVVVPHADEYFIRSKISDIIYAVPEAFRKEMMKAMKENAPRQYQERIKRYYEELVR